MKKLKEILFQCEESFEEVMEAIFAVVARAQKANELSEFVSREEAMNLLKCEKTKLSTLREQGELTYVLVGKSYSYQRGSIQAYMKRNQINSNYEHE